MRFTDYQVKAGETAQYPQDIALLYVTLGLAGETGEIAEKVKKAYRDDGGVITDERREALAKEIGDVCWYIARLCTELDLSLDEVAQANIDKLASRKARGVIHGNGDSR